MRADVFTLSLRSIFRLRYFVGLIFVFSFQYKCYSFFLTLFLSSCLYYDLNFFFLVKIDSTSENWKLRRFPLSEDLSSNKKALVAQTNLSPINTQDYSDNGNFSSMYFKLCSNYCCNWFFKKLWKSNQAKPICQRLPSTSKRNNIEPERKINSKGIGMKSGRAEASKSFQRKDLID